MSFRSADATILEFCYNMVVSASSGQDGKIQKQATCNYCNKIYKATGSTTSNFRRHIKSLHPEGWKEFLGTMKSPTRAPIKLDCFTSSEYKPEHTEHTEQQQFVKSIALNLVVDCDLPLNIVSHPGFIRHHEIANSGYNTVDRRDVQRALDEEVDKYQQKLQAKLQEAESVSVTIDIWSDQTMRGYLGLTVHYIDGYSLMSDVLGVPRFQGSHTGMRICDKYKEVMTTYGICDKVSYIITDNASNMKAALKVHFPNDHGSSTSEEHHCETGALMANSTDGSVDSIETERISCFAHSLQLTIRDGLVESKAASVALSKAVSVSNLLHRSTLYKKKFEEKFGRGVGIPATDNTRWDAVLCQIDSILDKGLTELNDVSKAVEHQECVFSETEWDQLQELSDILGPFKVYTDMLQGDTSVTISLIVPTVLSLYNGVVAHLNEVRFLYKMLTTLKDKLKQRFLGIFVNLNLAVCVDPNPPKPLPFSSKVYITAAILDPNLKLHWLDDVQMTQVPDSLDDVEQEENGVKEMLKEKLQELVIKWAADISPQDVSEDISIVQEEAAYDPKEQVPVVKKRKMVNIRTKYLQKQLSGLEGRYSGLSQNTAKKQMEKYLSFCHKDIKLNSDGDLIEINPFKFWFDNASDMPALAKLANIVLSVPASSAPIKRVLSHGRRLADTNLSQLIYLKVNRLKLNIE